MRGAIYAYSPTTTDIKNDFDYKGFLDAISAYMKFLLKNFGLFPSPDAKATLLKVQPIQLLTNALKCLN